MLNLKSNLCYLTPFTTEHLESSSYFDWLHDYEVIATLNKTDYLRPVSYDEVVKYCKNVMSSQEDMLFAIHENRQQHFIGTLRISKLNWRARTADVGIMIGDRNFWGQGIATSAIGLIGNYLFFKCGLRKLTAGYMSNNVGMGKAFQKVGFKQEGVLRQQDFFEGEYV